MASASGSASDGPSTASTDNTDGVNGKPGYNYGDSTAGGSDDKKTDGLTSTFYRNPEGGTWADQLRSFQIDVPEAGLEALNSERERIAASQKLGVGGRGGGVGVAGGEDGNATGGGAPGMTAAVLGDASGGVNGDVGPAWDGQGVDASTVIQHRRRFDARCSSYEALNNSTKNDKTSALVERTHGLHREHFTIIVAKRGTLEGTLENVRSQLSVREDQLRLLRAEQRGLNPMDSTAVASLAESERALMTRIAEKKVQMMMIMDEAAKVVEWERAADMARREALLHASDVHGHGGASAVDAAQERGALVDAMMSQKATIMLLSTFCKLRGPWLAPAGYMRSPPPIEGRAKAVHREDNRTVEEGSTNTAPGSGCEAKDRKTEEHGSVVPSAGQAQNNVRSRSSSPYAFPSSSLSLVSPCLPRSGASMGSVSALSTGGGPMKTAVRAAGDKVSPGKTSVVSDGSIGSCSGDLVRGGGIGATRLGLKLEGGRAPNQRKLQGSEAVMAGMPSGSPSAAATMLNSPGRPGSDSNSASGSPSAGGTVGNQGKSGKKPIKLRLLPPSVERRRSKKSPLVSSAPVSPMILEAVPLQDGSADDLSSMEETSGLVGAEEQDVGLGKRSPSLARIARGGKEAVLARSAEAAAAKRAKASLSREGNTGSSEMQDGFSSQGTLEGAAMDVEDAIASEAGTSAATGYGRDEVDDSEGNEGASGSDVEDGGGGDDDDDDDDEDDDDDDDGEEEEDDDDDDDDEDGDGDDDGGDDDDDDDDDDGDDDGDAVGGGDDDDDDDDGGGGDEEEDDDDDVIMTALEDDADAVASSSGDGPEDQGLGLEESCVLLHEEEPSLGLAHGGGGTEAIGTGWG